MKKLTKSVGVDCPSKKELTETFHALDLNGDDSLQFNELKPVLNRLIKDAANKG